MIVRLFRKCKSETGHALDYCLVDILRTLSRYDHDSVIPRHWRVSDLDLWTYLASGYDAQALRLMFPELGESSQATNVMVTGERLLERAALVHQFESGFFLRIVNPRLAIELQPDYRLWHGPAAFQATNTDLEIRCDEAAPYEVVSDDPQLVEALRGSFAETEVG